MLWIENMCVGLRREDVSIGRSVGSGAIWFNCLMILVFF